jgi:nucleotide-binding universal stress UspA family protein
VASGLTLLVPFTGSPASLRGLDVALRMARSEKNSQIQAIFVVEVDRRLPLDVELPEETERGERCLSEAEEVARRYNLTCGGDILQARDAGHAVVDEAVSLGVDAVVIGVARSGREGQALDLGKTVEYVLRHAPCEVIVVRDGTPV